MRTYTNPNRGTKLETSIDPYSGANVRRVISGFRSGSGPGSPWSCGRRPGPSRCGGPWPPSALFRIRGYVRRGRGWNGVSHRPAGCDRAWARHAASRGGCGSDGPAPSAGPRSPPGGDRCPPGRIRSHWPGPVRPPPVFRALEYPAVRWASVSFRAALAGPSGRITARSLPFPAIRRRGAGTEAASTVRPPADPWPRSRSRSLKSRGQQCERTGPGQPLPKRPDRLSVRPRDRALPSIPGEKPGAALRGRRHSFVAGTDVHCPTDRNLPMDAARRMVRDVSRACVSMASLISPKRAV